MRFVDQEHLNDPATGTLGDCVRACIASVLDLPREEVPHFLLKPDGTPCEAWWLQFHRWCRERGFFPVTVKWKDINGHYWWWDSDQCYIVFGQSPRGQFQHAVVYQDTKLLHDPHPSREGIVGDPDEILLLARLVIAKEPGEDK